MVEEPPVAEDMPLSEKGRLIHSILSGFTKRRLNRKLEEMAETEVFASMREAADEAFGSLAFLDDPFASVFRKDLLDDSGEEWRGVLAEFINIEREGEEESRFVPVAVETRWEVEAPGEIAGALGAGRDLNLKMIARVDRCDAQVGGAFGRGEKLVLYDYKTGADQPGLKETIEGTEFQLPFYLFLAKCVGFEPCAAAIYKVRPREKVARKSYIRLSDISPVFNGRRDTRSCLDLCDGGAAERFLEEIGKRIAQVMKAVASGHFPPMPFDGSACMRCPFHRICRVDAGLSSARRQALAGVEGMYFPRPFRVRSDEDSPARGRLS
jgi:ATP-dependent helicase/DNAse subunit B